VTSRGAAPPAEHVRPRPAAPGRSAADRGTVTVELALGLPAVVGVLVAVLLLGAAASAQLRCADGARAGARAAALGEDVATVSSTAARVAGNGATVRVQRDGTWVVVTVRRPVTTAPLGGPTWTAEARATARVEP
jgi:Flp pilus assembly protein TadG